MGAKTCKTGYKRVCFFAMVKNFGKKDEGKLRQNKNKNAYLGSSFMAGKYVIRVFFFKF